MAKNELKAVVTADVKDFNKKMESLSITAKTAASKVKVAFAVIGAATLALGLNAIRTAASYQLLEKRLQGVFGKQRGSELFKQIAESAQQSALETDDLVESYIRFSALIGKEPKFKTIESIGFAAKLLGKDVGFTTEQMARFFNQLERGEKIDKDLRDSLVGVFGKDVMGKAAEGTLTVAEAMKTLNERGTELKELMDTGIDAAISKLKGSWDKLMLSLGNENLVHVEKLLGDIAESISELAESGAIKQMAALMGFVAKHWKAILISVGVFKGLMITVQLINVAVNALTAHRSKQLVGQNVSLTAQLVALQKIQIQLAAALAIENEITRQKQLQAVLTAAGATHKNGLPRAIGGAAVSAAGGAAGGAAAGGAAAGGAAAGMFGIGAAATGTAVLGTAIVGGLQGFFYGKGITSLWSLLESDRTNFGSMNEAEANRFRREQREKIEEEALKRIIANLPLGPPAT